MPGTAYGLPAKACITGSKLAKHEGTVCSQCYAMRDQYTYPNTQMAQERRLKSLSNPDWVSAMVYVLKHYHRMPRIKVDLGTSGIRKGQRYMYNQVGYHRWHDSGDLQSVEHLAHICEVAHWTPRIKHWLPTLEHGIVREYLKGGGVIPGNLIVRLSSPKIGKMGLDRGWPHTSSVSTLIGWELVGIHACPAHQQDNKCGRCRACWDKKVPHVVYELH
jgi:hypothetical protein